MQIPNTVPQLNSFKKPIILDNLSKLNNFQYLVTRRVLKRVDVLGLVKYLDDRVKKFWVTQLYVLKKKIKKKKQSVSDLKDDWSGLRDRLFIEEGTDHRGKELIHEVRDLFPGPGVRVLLKFL